MLNLAVLIDLSHTYISHEGKKSERLGLPKTQIFCFLEKVPLIPVILGLSDEGLMTCSFI
jgi:hypothetical protein